MALIQFNNAKLANGQLGVLQVSGLNSDILRIYDLISENEFVIGVAGLVVDVDVTAEWNETKTFGKMDPIATYKTTTKSYKIGFAINDNAQNILNLFSQLMYPSFAAFPKTPDALTGAQDLKNRFGLILNAPLFKLYHSTFLSDFTQPKPGAKDPDSAKKAGILGYIKDLKFERSQNGFQSPTTEVSFKPEGFNANIKSHFITFTFVPLHQALLDRQNDNFRKNFPLNSNGFETSTNAQASTYQNRLVNSKLSELFSVKQQQVAGAEIPEAPAAPEPPVEETTPAPAATPEATPAASTDTLNAAPVGAPRGP